MSFIISSNKSRKQFEIVLVGGGHTVDDAGNKMFVSGAFPLERNNLVEAGVMLDDGHGRVCIFVTARPPSAEHAIDLVGRDPGLFVSAGMEGLLEDTIIPAIDFRDDEGKGLKINGPERELPFRVEALFALVNTSFVGKSTMSMMVVKFGKRGGVDFVAVIDRLDSALIKVAKTVKEQEEERAAIMGFDDDVLLPGGTQPSMERLRALLDAE